MTSPDQSSMIVASFNPTGGTITPYTAERVTSKCFCFHGKNKNILLVPQKEVKEKHSRVTLSILHQPGLTAQSFTTCKHAQRRLVVLCLRRPQLIIHFLIARMHFPPRALGFKTQSEV